MSYVFAVITVSDSCYNKKAEDKSGPCLNRLLDEFFPTKEMFCEIVPDDKAILEQMLYNYADSSEAHAIFTVGGTGFSSRDITPEVTRAIIEKECPQLTLAMALESFKKTPFAALSRAVCGIRKNKLIINFPGSVKAVQECFGAIKMVLPHAIQLLNDDLELVKVVHQQVQSQHVHVCPHKTGAGGRDDRNSPYPMLNLKEAQEIVFQTVKRIPTNSNFFQQFSSPVDIPPFRASIKDGYALKSTGFPGVRKVVGFIAAGDDVNNFTLEDDECFKINTGAPLPDVADCVVQVEDTKLLKVKKDGTEELVEILVDPQSLLDVRPIGCDLKKGNKLFPAEDYSDVVFKSLLSSVGQIKKLEKRKVVVISTGSELLDPADLSNSTTKIYDSNTTMLVELLKYFGFECVKSAVVKDDVDSVKKTIKEVFELADFVVCTGGVSMGDKDYIKPVLNDLGFTIHFGRVNMKPGKPMTFASCKDKCFFGLPGNPVSAFVTFHLFVLPALRYASGWDRNKCELAKIQVKLSNEELLLDPRPEFARASVSSRDGILLASVRGSQMSSRLQSIVGADVLLHLPGRSDIRKSLQKGESLTASVLRYDFISNYE